MCSWSAAVGVENIWMFYRRGVQAVLGGIVAEDFFMYFGGMNKICIAVAITSQHLEFSLGL